jgi:hypothetical protein
MALALDRWCIGGVMAKVRDHYRSSPFEQFEYIKGRSAWDPILSSKIDQSWFCK